MKAIKARAKAARRAAANRKVGAPVRRVHGKRKLEEAEFVQPADID